MTNSPLLFKILKYNRDFLVKAYANTVFFIVFIYFVIYGISLNFILEGEWGNYILFFEKNIFWFLFLEFIARIATTIFVNIKNPSALLNYIFSKPLLLDYTTFGAIYLFPTYLSEILWIRIFRVLYLLHLLDRVHITLLRFRESNFFSRLNIVVILFFAFMIGLQNSIEFDSKTEFIFKSIDVAVLMYFVIEIAIKMLSKKNVLEYFIHDGKLNKWNTFDFLIVFFSVIPWHNLGFENASGLAVARVLRVLRTVRLITSFGELKNIIKALTNSVNSIIYVVFLLFIIFFIYANIGVQFFGHFTYAEGMPNLWKDLPAALLTLYRVLTFEDWTDVMYQANEYYPFFGPIYFVSFTAITVFIFLNLFTAIIIEKIQKENSNILKYRLKDEKNELADGIKLYNSDDFVVIINENDKLDEILIELDLDAIRKNKVIKIILVLTDIEKIRCYEDGDCFLGYFKKLKLQFVYADVMKEETHHRFDFSKASSVIILANSNKNDGVSTIRADNLNIKLFNFLMNDKKFVINLIYGFLVGKRINSLIELNSKPSENMVRNIMQRSIAQFIELYDIYEKDSSTACKKTSEDILLNEKFKETIKLFKKRCSGEKNSNYRAQFPGREFFGIVNESKYTGVFLSRAIEYRSIYRAMLTFLSNENGSIKYEKIIKPLIGESFERAYLLYDDGILLGYSRRNDDGFIESHINPDPSTKLTYEDHLIFYSSSKEIKIGKKSKDIDKKNQDIIHSFPKKSAKLLVIEDGSREISLDENLFKEIEHVREDGKISEFFKNENSVLETSKYDFIVINLSENRTYNLTLLFLETFVQKGINQDKIVAIFDENMSAKLLEESFYKYKSSIVSKNLTSLLISRIADNSHIQNFIDKLVLHKPDAKNMYSVKLTKVKLQHNKFKNFDDFKVHLLRKRLLYVASVDEDDNTVTINDKNFEKITNIIAITIQEKNLTPDTMANYVPSETISAIKEDIEHATQGAWWLLIQRIALLSNNYFDELDKKKIQDKIIGTLDELKRNQDYIKNLKNLSAENILYNILYRFLNS